MSDIADVTDNVCISLGDERIEVPVGTKILLLADKYRERYADDIILAVYNGRLRELGARLTVNGSLEFVTVADKNGRRAYRRSVILLMERAMELIYPGKAMDILVKYSLGSGYFCKIKDMDEISEHFLSELETEMRRLVEKDIDIDKITMNTDHAVRIFDEMGLEDKCRLLRYRTSSNINIYDMDGYKDYYYGYMAPSTGMLGVFKLYRFEDGFVLQFAGQDSRHTAEFDPAVKLFNVLKASDEWSHSMDIPTVGALNDAICAGKTRDIILSQEAYMERRIGALAEKIAGDKDKKFVMIAGPSSSGKTTFSHRLSAQLNALGVNPHPVPLDDYYLDRDTIPEDEYGEKDLESITAIDVEQFNEDMLNLLRGEEVLLPNFNFKTGKREYRDHRLRLGSKDILVIEGIHGLNEQMSYALPKENKFKIYISALTQLSIDEHNPLPTSDGRLIRRIVRDSRTRDTSARETIAMWDSVRRGEEKYIFPFQEEADEMFNSALVYEMAVLKTHALPQLFAIPKDCEEYQEAKRLIKMLDYFLNIPNDDICNNSLLREFIGGSCFNV